MLLPPTLMTVFLGDCTISKMMIDDIIIRISSRINQDMHWKCFLIASWLDEKILITKSHFWKSPFVRILVRRRDNKPVANAFYFWFSFSFHFSPYPHSTPMCSEVSLVCPSISRSGKRANDDATIAANWRATNLVVPVVRTKTRRFCRIATESLSLGRFSNHASCLFIKMLYTYVRSYIH